MTCGCTKAIPKGETCPEAFGPIRFAGLDWEGLPAPVRFTAWAWLAWRHDLDEEPAVYYRRFPGCGCIVVLKRAWLAYVRWSGA